MLTYYPSLFREPNKIIKRIDKMICGFLWESSRGEGGVHNINLETTQLTKLMGGLGFGNFHSQNLALLAKWV